MTGQPLVHVVFQEHVDLLRLFLTLRDEIVESIEALLNAQRKPVSWLQNRPLLSRLVDDCFFAPSVVTASRLHFRGQLEEAHWASGFRPRQVHYVHNDLVHPAEMMIRAFHCWQQTQWPGRNGRLHYANTLFNLYVIRHLEFLGMRLWDEKPDTAGERLAEIQRVLDQLWKSSPADQPVFVRDARWLIPLALSPITDELAPYFEVVRQAADSMPKEDAIEIQKAHVRMLGGHLTSQIRHYCTKDGVSINEPSVVVRSRTSNALDFGLLVEGLVGLLKAYDQALLSGDERMRIQMAGAICQGISADPELFLNRVDLLSAYTMIEHVFIAAGTNEDSPGQIAYSPLGERHVRLLQEYRALMGRLASSLRDDSPRFRPPDGGYSPYGVMFGTPTNLIEHMALKTLQRDAETRFSLEDVFDDQDTSKAKLAWVNGWRKLPHIDPEVQRIYDYPQQFAEEIYGRVEQELSRRATGTGSGIGRLHIAPLNGPETDLNASAIPELPARYWVSSDRQIVPARKAELYEQSQLLRDRREGHYLVSYETSGGWMALKKELLTEVLGAGRDARIVGLPPGAAQRLRLICAGLTMPQNVDDRASESPSAGRS